MEYINHLLSVIGNVSTAPMLASVAIALEFAFRMVKTEKPLSIAYMIADGFKKVGELLSKCGVILDKILPQRLK